MTVTSDDIKNDIGELYDAVYDGTTTINSLITRAENFIKLQLTSDYDEILRPLASSLTVQHCMGGIDPVNKTIGSLSVGEKDLKSMHIILKAEANKAAVIKGVSLDGLKIILRDTEF